MWSELNLNWYYWTSYMDWGLWKCYQLKRNAHFHLLHLPFSYFQLFAPMVTTTNSYSTAKAEVVRTCAHSFSNWQNPRNDAADLKCDIFKSTYPFDLFIFTSIHKILQKKNLTKKIKWKWKLKKERKHFLFSLKICWKSFQ